MKTPRRAGQPLSDPDAVRHGWRPSMGYLVIAIGLAVTSLVFLLMSSDENDNAASPATSSASERDTFVTWTPPPLPAPSMAPDVTPGVSERSAENNVEGSLDPTRDITFYLARGEKPTMPEVIERLNQAGVHTGLGAFSPPGTRPPLVGLAVPTDFVLPPGYVRHHQATDDGQRIEAILMYSPDYQFVDAANQPIAIPKNRVVPPEHAPPGMPIRHIVIPAPTDRQ